jgi:bile acid:Na+ symporter, BASS family
MSSHALILIAIKASLALMVLGVGLQSTLRDTGVLVRHPGLFARSFVAMSVLMPLLALTVAASFTLTPAVSLALIALTLSPVPPFLPGKAERAGGDGSYVVSLFATASLLAIVVVPLSLWLLGSVLDASLRMQPLVIAKLVGTSVLLPLFVGIGVRAIAPRVAQRLAKPIALVSTIALVAAVLPVVIASWPAMRTLIGNGTLAAIVGLALIGLAIGHLLGGPAEDDRTVLALATATRHPAVAVAILSTNYPGEPPLTAAVLLALIVGAVASAPYIAWRKRAASRPVPGPHIPLAFKSP